MKTINILSLAVAAMTTIACSNNDIGGTEGPDIPKSATRTIVLTASTPQNAATRTMYSGTKMLWQKGDQVALVSATDNSYSEATLTLDGNGGSSSGTFTGTDAVNGTPKAVVYPASAYSSVSSDYLNLNFPATYDYTTVGKEFSDNVNSCNMYAVSSSLETESVSDTSVTVSAKMSYASGVFALKVPYLPSASGSVTITSATNRINGIFSYENETLATSQATEASQCQVTINYQNAEAGQAGVFYFPLPTGEYSLTATVKGENGGVNVSYTTTKAKSVTIAAGNIKNVTLTSVVSAANYIPQGYALMSGSKTVCQNTSDEYRYMIYGDKDEKWHEMVDIGITTNDKKVLFATMNIGATLPADAGNYYGWGETEPQSSKFYNWANYKYGNSITDLSKYNSSDGLTTLEDTDDAAYVNWGTSFRMPTENELRQLVSTSKCTWTWTQKINSQGTSYNGYNFACKTNTNNNDSIFLPASGQYYNEDGTLWEYNNQRGFYWTRTLYSGGKEFGVRLSIIYNTSPVVKDNYSYRFTGLTIRPVAEL